MTMMTASPPRPQALVVTGGVDTHADAHVAAALDGVGRTLGTRSFPTTPGGYDAMISWWATFGPIDRVGVEGTGSYGAGLSRHLRGVGISVIEVDRPDRSSRRSHGKTDVVDAIAAARAVQSGRATTTPKTRDGVVEMIRTLRVARASAIKARTAAINQLKAEIRTAPEPLRTTLRTLQGTALTSRCSRLRPTTADGVVIDVTAAIKLTLSTLARRITTLAGEISDLDGQLTPLVTTAAPTLTATFGVGIDVAGQLLVTAGDNPDRIASDAQFAHLCGVAPIPASSGKTSRMRLNRGGDRQANRAIHQVVLVRLSHDPATRDYMTRRSSNTFGKKDVIRCLKRYVARQLYTALRTDLAHLHTPT